MAKKKILLAKYVSKGPYSVVLFKEKQDKLYEVIPDTWFIDEEQMTCYWPPKSGKSVTLRAMNGEKPDDDWEICACEVISSGHATYSSGSSVVRQKCKQNYNTSSADEHIAAAKFRRQHPGLALQAKQSFENVFGAHNTKKVGETKNKESKSRETLSPKSSRHRLVRNSRNRSPVVTERSCLPLNSSSADHFTSQNGSALAARISRSRCISESSDKRKSRPRGGTIDRSLLREKRSKSKCRNGTENRRTKSKSRSKSPERSSNSRSVDRVRSAKRQSRSRSSTIDRSRSRENRLKSKTSNGTQNQTAKSKNQRKSPERSSNSRSVDRVRSAKRQSRSRSSTIDRSRSRENRLKSKTSNGTQNQTAKSKNQRKSPVISRIGRNRSLSRRNRTGSERSGSGSARSRSRSRSSGSGSIRSVIRSIRSGSGSIKSRSRSRRSRSGLRSSGSGSRNSQSGSRSSQCGSRSSRIGSKSSRSGSRRSSRTKSKSRASPCSYSRNRSLSLQRTRRQSRSSRSLSSSSFRRNGRSSSHINISSGDESLKRMEQNLKEAKDLIADSNNKQVCYAHENDRRFARLEVTINKIFIMLGDMASSQIAHSTTKRDRRKPPRGFKMPDIPLDSIRELTVMHRKLKDKEFRSFLLYHEKEFCSPDTSSKRTANVVMTAYLKRFVSLRLRSSLTLKDLKGKKGLTLCDDFRRVYLFLIDVMKEGYQMSKKSISFDDAHGVLRVVWGRSKQLLKDQQKNHRKGREHKKTKK